ncbi:metal dependent amidohydrolase [Plectosphaerella plurivora]|uniref:Metal dependent amidohydrolase n=1 Tax=Plectosphaerella plurivora TaxID=936078 RepID=A0A9P8V0C4_9PEZI|nr:metal dependent amidohydrolase [Plectosphaerella plurivora]
MAPSPRKLLAPLAAASLFAVVDASCRLASTGTSGDVLLKGTVLTSEGAVANGRLLVQAGKIAYAGSQCGFGPEPEDITVVECTGSVISPGFINTHEHIEYSTVTPLVDIGERVDHRHDWRRGLRGNTMRPAPVNGSAVAATAWGELRHMFSGTTSIVGGAMAPGLTRNLDFVAGLESGILSPVATWDIFPLNDARGILRNGDCDYGPNMTSTEAAGKLYRYMAHVGEGVDAEAANEFRCLSDKTFDVTPQQGGGGLSTDIIRPNLALIHALGLSEADFDLVAERKATIVWSPRSNVFLYGKTLDVKYLLDAGITVALGTDWLPSGSATMSREAICGFSATKISYGTTLDTKTIWEMMTINAATVAGFEKHVGSFQKGKVADIAIFGGEALEDSFAQAVFADPKDIELVMRGGKVLLASERLDGLAKGLCEQAVFGNVNKTVCVEEELGRSFAAFEASLGGVYPAILPGVPDGEPTCEPTR